MIYLKRKYIFRYICEAVTWGSITLHYNPFQEVSETAHWSLGVHINQNCYGKTVIL